jgi:hypothetical protein
MRLWDTSYFGETNLVKYYNVIVANPGIYIGPLWSNILKSLFLKFEKLNQINLIKPNENKKKYNFYSYKYLSL